jgi:hypothetical protein
MGRKILLVDDKPELLMRVEARLSANGMKSERPVTVRRRWKR